MPELNVSLNEVEMTTLKAARGSGLPWGIAEEAGFACRWLAARGLPFAEPLACVLIDPKGSPLLAGISFSDKPHAAVVSCPLTLDGIVEPLLLLPFIANVARATRQLLRVQWPNSDYVLSACETCKINGAPAAGRLMIGRWEPTADMRLAPLPRTLDGVDVTKAAWRDLENLAARTYVPESQQSRQKGAGSGSVEED